ncbi:MAG: peptide ABC transporter substrate-binding protein [Phycisphaeraceae bacterium]
MTRIAIIFGVIALATLGLAFASYDYGPPPLPEDKDNRGTLTFAIPNDPGSLDPGRTSASTDFRVVKCIYEPLLVVKWGGGGLDPGTAKAMPEVSEDGLTYTFTLRDDAKWSDGRPVTAHDFVYAWRRAMLIETASDYSTLFNVIEGVDEFVKWRDELVNLDSVFETQEARDAFLSPYPALKQQIEAAGDDPTDDEKQAINEAKWELTKQEFDKRVGIEAVRNDTRTEDDDRVLRVTLASPTAYFVDLCAFPTFSPLPRHVMTELEGIDDAGLFLPFDYFGDPDQLVTNGPYVLSQWKRKVRMVFDQNPAYWNKDNMGNIRIVQETIPDPSLQLLRFEQGKLDWIPDVGELKKKLLREDFPNVHAVPVAGTYYYQFNCQPKLPNGVDNPMSDPRVRRAMAMCIDRQTIVTNVTQGGEPATELLVPDADIPGYVGPSDRAVSYDPAAGRALLAEAGYPNGEGFPKIDVLVNNDAGSGHANIALAIIKSWEDNLGLEVGLEQIEFKVLLERSKKGNFSVRRAGWFGDYIDPTTWLDMYRTKDSNNDGKYLNPAYDKLLADAAVELDKPRRFELLADAEAMLLNDAPVVPIFYYVTVMVYDADKLELRPNAWNNFRLELVPIKRDQ